MTILTKFKESKKTRSRIKRTKWNRFIVTKWTSAEQTHLHFAFWHVDPQLPTYMYNHFFSVSRFFISSSILNRSGFSFVQHISRGPIECTAHYYFAHPFVTVYASNGKGANFSLTRVKFVRLSQTVQVNLYWLEDSRIVLRSEASIKTLFSCIRSFDDKKVVLANNNRSQSQEKVDDKKCPRGQLT